LDFVAAFWACISCRVIAVPVPEPFAQRHITRVNKIVTDAGATVVLTASRSLADHQRKLDELDGVRWLATDAIPPASTARLREDSTPDAVAFLQYTSGSTGSPRGVVVSQRNAIVNATMLRECFDADERTVFVSWLPVFHDMGLVTKLITSFCCGGHCVLMSPFSFLRKPARWLDTIARFRANVSGGPDFAYAQCVRRVTDEQCRGLDLSSWRVAFVGAEPVRPATLRAFADRFGDFGFREHALRPGYGLAEATVFVSAGSEAVPPTVLDVDAAAFERGRIALSRGGSTIASVSCGRVSYGRQSVRIVDPVTGTERAPSEI